MTDVFNWIFSDAEQYLEPQYFEKKDEISLIA